MHNPIQQVLLTPSLPVEDDSASRARAPAKETTSRLAGRAMGLSILLGLSLAVATVSMLAGAPYFRTGAIGFLSRVGLGLMVWAAATFVFVLAATIVISRHRDAWRPQPIAVRHRSPSRN
jgi:hypothetical protein